MSESTLPSIQSPKRRQRKPKQDRQIKHQKMHDDKTHDDTDLPELEYPLNGTTQDNDSLLSSTITPVTKAIAHSPDLSPKWTDKYANINENEFDIIKGVLQKCLRIMYCPKKGYIYGTDVLFEMNLFLHESWTYKTTMTEDGMPIYERDTVIALLEMIEKYLSYVAFVDRPKIAEEICRKLDKACKSHFNVRSMLQKLGNSSSKINT